MLCNKVGNSKIVVREKIAEWDERIMVPQALQPVGGTAFRLPHPRNLGSAKPYLRGSYPLITSSAFRPERRVLCRRQAYRLPFCRSKGAPKCPASVPPQRSLDLG